MPADDEAFLALKRLVGREGAAFFAKPAKRPAAVMQRRWDALSAEEQAFIAPVEEEMKLRGYNPRTRKSYRNHLLRFRRFFAAPPCDLEVRAIRGYLLHLVDDKRVSAAYQTQAA